jgi:hypothetical protein
VEHLEFVLLLTHVAELFCGQETEHRSKKKDGKNNGMIKLGSDRTIAR